MSPFVRPPWSYPLASTSVLVTAPSEEPLTLAQAKLRAGVTWANGDPREPLLNDFVKAARSKVEFDTGLALLTQTRDISIAASSNGLMALPWQAAPVQTITFPDGSPVDPGFFVMDLSYRVLRWSSPLIPGGTWRVVAGWEDAETLAAEAPLLVHAVGLLVAHFATLGRDLASIDPAEVVPYGYEDAIAPYRAIWLT